MNVDFPQHARPWIAPVMTCKNHWTMGKWFSSQGFDVAVQAIIISKDHSSRVNTKAHEVAGPSLMSFFRAPTEA